MGTMERSISRKMSREEVVASMANKLADGSVEGTKKKYHRKILIINLSVILFFGTMVFFVSITKKTPHQELQKDFFTDCQRNAKSFGEIKKRISERVNWGR